jgi:hypothetical protein
MMTKNGFLFFGPVFDSFGFWGLLNCFSLQQPDSCSNKDEKTSNNSTPSGQPGFPTSLPPTLYYRYYCVFRYYFLVFNTELHTTGASCSGRGHQYIDCDSPLAFLRKTCPMRKEIQSWSGWWKSIHALSSSATRFNNQPVLV